MKFKSFLIATAAMAMTAAAARAEDFTLGKLTIANVQLRQTIAGRPAAAFFTIKNAGDRADKLVSVSSALARRVEIHHSAMEGGVMKMRPVDGVAIPANAAAMLKPGGYHVMLFGIARKLDKGAKVPLTLHFQTSGEVKVMATVGAPAMMHMNAGEPAQ